jgi:hypothetical protein
MLKEDNAYPVPIKNFDSSKKGGKDKTKSKKKKVVEI